MITKIGKFLQIFFGCHSRPDRSFYYKGKQFPICARCTGEMIGIVIGIPLAVRYRYIDIFLIVMMMLPMLGDGFIQLLTSYESKNIRRLWTGILFGIAFIFLILRIHRICVLFAGKILFLFSKNPDGIKKAMDLLL